MTAKNYAIKTGHLFTVVTVDADSNQCLVDHSVSGRLAFEGTHEDVILRAAQDGAGAGFKTLREAMESREGVVRRRDLDC